MEDLEPPGLARARLAAAANVDKKVTMDKKRMAPKETDDEKTEETKADPDDKKRKKREPEGLPPTVQAIFALPPPPGSGFCSRRARRNKT